MGTMILHRHYITIDMIWNGAERSNNLGSSVGKRGTTKIGSDTLTAPSREGSDLKLLNCAVTAGKICDQVSSMFEK